MVGAKMTQKRENMKCYLCGGTTEFETATVPFTVGTNVVVVKDVPAKVCTQCGEVTLNSEAAAVIDRLLKQAQQVGLEVSVVSYEQLNRKSVAE